MADVSSDMVRDGPARTPVLEMGYSGARPFPHANLSAVAAAPGCAHCSRPRSGGGSAQRSLEAAGTRRSPSPLLRNLGSCRRRRCCRAQRVTAAPPPGPAAPPTALAARCGFGPPRGRHQLQWPQPLPLPPAGVEEELNVGG